MACVDNISDNQTKLAEHKAPLANWPAVGGRRGVEQEGPVGKVRGEFVRVCDGEGVRAAAPDSMAHPSCRVVRCHLSRPSMLHRRRPGRGQLYSTPYFFYLLI
jgi:hypothetical protein